MFFKENHWFSVGLTKSAINSIMCKVNFSIYGGYMLKSIVFGGMSSQEFVIVYTIMNSRCVFTQAVPRNNCITINWAEEIIGEIMDNEKRRYDRFYNLLIIRKHRPFVPVHESRPHLEFCEVISQLEDKPDHSTDFKHTRFPDQLREVFNGLIPNNVKQKSNMVASRFGQKIHSW